MKSHVGTFKKLDICWIQMYLGFIRIPFQSDLQSQGLLVKNVSWDFFLDALETLGFSIMNAEFCPGPFIPTQTH